VCEDYFGGAETVAAATPEQDGAAPTDALAEVDYSAIKAFAGVSYSNGDLQRSSSILYIAE
ncbi:MAG TPA: hypothetical protein VHG52_09820, partial [Thermomicrobiales bacterium]|nr:hypothetical protein [Thermomicrobiales bacterium]